MNMLTDNIVRIGERMLDVFLLLQFIVFSYDN